MKAFRDKKDKIRLFRPELNMSRFHSSCIRTTLPGFDQVELLEVLKQFVLIEKSWIS